jgi:hypothetical protein
MDCQFLSPSFCLIPSKFFMRNAIGVREFLRLQTYVLFAYYRLLQEKETCLQHLY